MTMTNNYCGNQITVATKKPQEQNNWEGKQLWGKMAMRTVIAKQASTAVAPALWLFALPGMDAGTPLAK